jgi:hypothetical protein
MKPRPGSLRTMVQLALTLSGLKKYGTYLPSEIVDS